MYTAYKTEEVTFPDFESYYIETRGLEDTIEARSEIIAELASYPENQFELWMMCNYLDKKWELLPGSAWVKGLCNCQHNHL